MVVYNVLSTVLVAGVNFLTIPIFTRMLDTDGFGIVNIYVAWVQICTVFVGLKADGSIGSAYANLDEREQDSYQLSVLLMGSLSFVCILIASIVFLEPLSSLLGMSRLLVVAMVLQSFGAFVVALFSMRFIFRKQPKSNFFMSVGVCLATTVLSIILIFCGVFGEEAYMGRVLGLSIPNLLLGIGLLGALLVKAPGVKLSYWKFCLVLTLPLMFHGLSQLVLAQTGKIAIQQYQGNSMAGIYSIAVTVVSLMNAIYSALNNAFVPFMYDDLAGKTSEEIKQKHFRNYFTLFTLGMCAFVFMAPEILKILSTEAYWDAVRLLPPLMFGQYCVFLYSFPVNYEFFKMKTASIAVGTLGAAVLNIGLCVLLVPSIGMDGAAAATAVAYAFLFLFHFCIARFYLGDRNYSPKWFLGGLILVGVMCLLCYPLDDFPLIRWAVGVVCLALVCLRVLKTRTII